MTQPNADAQFAAFQAYLAAQQNQAPAPQAQFPQYNPLQQFQAPAASANPGVGTPVPTAPAVPHIEVNLDDFLGQQSTAGGAGIPIGDMAVGQSISVQFKVDIDKTHIRPQTKPNTTEVLYQSDGNPRLVMVAPVTRLDNSEDAAWWVSGAHWDALKAGMATVGASGVPKAGDLAQITVTKKFKNKFGTTSTSIRVVYASAKSVPTVPATPPVPVVHDVASAPVTASAPAAAPVVPPTAAPTLGSVQPAPATVPDQFAGLPPELAAQLAQMTGDGNPTA